jgi:hypothetical protein
MTTSDEATRVVDVHSRLVALPTVSISPVVSMAVLKVNSDRGLDLIEQFVPFVAECVRSEQAAAVSLPAIQTAMRTMFGIRIPQPALKTVLGRAAQRGLVRRVHGTYVPDRERLAQHNLLPTRARVLREHGALVEKFISYADRTLNVALSEEQADRALLNYVSLRTAPLLAAVIDGSVVPRTDRDVRDPVEVALDGFIAHLHAADPAGFEFLTTIVKGSVLASVLYLDELGQATKSFRGLDFYFDTQFLLRACGFAGPAAADAARDLLTLLSAESARLRCFEHTMHEMEGILEAGLAIVRDPRRKRNATGETISHFLEVGFQPSDIVAFIGGLRSRLESLDIIVTPVPQVTMALSTDEVGFEELLKAEVNYGRREQLVVDVNSLTAVHRLRKGRGTRRLEDSKAVFVTTNMKVVGAARKQFSDDYAGGCIPVAMGANDLAALAWLKQPGTVPDLPAKVIVADAYAALCPPDDGAWQAYLQRIRTEEANGGVTPDDYRLLRHDLQVRTILLHRSLKTGEPFAEGDVHDVLARARDNIAAEVRADLDSARTNLGLRDGELEAERAQRALAEERAAKAEAERDAARVAADRRHDESVARVADKVTWTLARIPLLVVAAGIALASWMVLPAPLGPDLELWHGWIRLVAGTLVVAFCAAGCLGLFGVDVWAGVRFLERRLAPRVHTRVKGWMSAQREVSPPT